jgi:multidrug efflux system membrane fusion protein
VNTEIVQIRPMPVVLQTLGEVVPEHTVQVRPQVGGQLKRVFFTEGDAIVQGQRLFEIERAPFDAVADAARAAWENAKGKADRMAPLVEQGYVVRQDYLNARSAAEQAEAIYRQTQINLSYTDLKAPISGRTGSLSAKAGNIVSSSDPAPLVTITQMQPIEVQFGLPQQLLTEVRKFRAEHAIGVTVKGDDGSDLDRGVLVFIDNRINESNGSVVLKARFPNVREQLWPGQSARVTLQLAVQPHAVVVEQGAVQNGQKGSFVYLVAEGQARVRDVSIDRQAGDLSVISQGLQGGERVISKVPRNLRPGSRVSPAPVSASSQPDS